jgi:hypothetical protein
LDTYAIKFKHDLHNVSKWFVPSVGQLKLAFESMGLKVEKDSETKYYTCKPTSGNGTALDAVKKFLGNNADNLNSGKLNGQETMYWTATEAARYLAWTMRVDKNDRIYFGSQDKGTTSGPVVRPFLLMGAKGEFVPKN